MVLSYNASSGPYHRQEEARATIRCDGCGTWERLFELDADPDAGVHALAFANHGTKQAILSFRGACNDRKQRQCRADNCFLFQHQTYGGASAAFFGNDLDNRCALIDKRKLNYIKQARDRVELLKARCPGYNVVLTGHSLGGFLASVLAMELPGEVQAVSFSPSSFSRSVASDGHFDARDVVALCDPYDCGIETLAVRDARQGATTCLYETWDAAQVPKSCHGVKQYVEDSSLDFDEWPKTFECIEHTHWYMRYVQLANMSRGGDKKDKRPLLPVCSTSLSVISERLTQAMRFARREKKGPWSLPVSEV